MGTKRDLLEFAEKMFERAIYEYDHGATRGGDSLDIYLTVEEIIFLGKVTGRKAESLPDLLRGRPGYDRLGSAERDMMIRVIRDA